VAHASEQNNMTALRFMSIEDLLGLRLPISISRAIRTGKHDEIAIRVPHPKLPVIGPAAAIGGIAVPSHHDFDTHRLTAFDGGIDVGYFKPKRHPIPVRPLVRIADRNVVMAHQPGMQLQHETPIVNESLIFGPAVGALTSEQSLIPAAAGLDVVHANEGLGAHESRLSS
jgi:hypothetical protein